MSELIEVIERQLNQAEAARQAGVQLGLTITDAKEILSALSDQQTLRGIEGLAKEGSYVSIDNGIDGSWYIVFGEWSKRSLQQSISGATLPLAVEAAVAGIKQ